MVRILLVATSNPHKLREMQELLADTNLTLRSIQDHPQLHLPNELGLQVMDNARLKAVFCARSTGLPSLAEDSGIEVDALGGAPGVRSARWVAGTDQERTQRLVHVMRLVPHPYRTARYHSAMCVAFPGQFVATSEGFCEGAIALDPAGENGFGYDPVFQLTAGSGCADEWIGRTMAEAPPSEKARISHRARALHSMRPVLRLVE